MECKETITIKELLNSLGIDDMSCEGKIRRINRILRSFYSRTKDLHDNKIAESFQGTGIITIQTTEPILKVLDFYGNGSGEHFDSKTQCCDTSSISLQRTFKEPCPRERRKTCANEVEVNIPCDITQGYIVYSRGHNKITSINSDIIMDLDMIEGFEYLLEHFYAERDREFTSAQYFENKFNTRLKEKKKDVVPKRLIKKSVYTHKLLVS